MKRFFITHHRKIGWVIAVCNAIAVINSTYYFLAMAEFPVIAWLFFNACAPSVMLFLAGFVSRRGEIMAAALPFLLFFGASGLFVFGWSGTSLFAQAGHILMTFAVLYTIGVVAIEKELKKFIIGFIAGMIIFAVILPFQQSFVKGHPEYVKKLGDPTFEKMISGK
jgi:hypothetical protein